MLSSNNTATANNNTTMTTDENVAPTMTGQQLQFAKSEAAASLARSHKKAMAELEQNEPILMDNPSRFVLFPIKYQDVSKTFGYKSQLTHPSVL